VIVGGLLASWNETWIAAWRLYCFFTALILTELEQKIHVEGGLILVTEEAGANTYLLPVSSRWLVQCGAGVSIRLGAAATSSKEIAGNDVNVELFNGLIDKSACAVIAPRVAARLQEKFGR
jgi:hypothetical protein